VAGASLLRRWAEPHRRYHNLEHLRSVLDRVDELTLAATPAEAPADPDAVRLAAFFHDAVYDVGAPRDGRRGATANEARSASLAAMMLRELGAEQNRIDEVSRLVLLTADHLPAAGDRDGALLCDADLAILGSSEGGYVAYAAAVRSEYGAVPEAAFRSARAEVLSRLLQRPRLFATASGRRRWEVQARGNVAAELSRLELRSSPPM